MTQEEKDLLLKDLCVRLPYGVKISIPDLWTHDREIELLDEIFKGDDGLYRVNSKGQLIEHIKPYLFPLSSMTEEQLEEFYCKFVQNEINFNDFKKYYFETNSYYELLVLVSDCPFIIDWFIKNNFDYRGLIPMGLAIDATGLNIY